MENRTRLGRPRACRKISSNIKVNYFKPRGLPLSSLKEVELTKEEVEALRLKNIKNLDQTKCAETMKTSQSTFQRILASAYKKMSIAIVEGQAIKIIKE
jgi:predicted DNA-binding protein (UPF0251 family)